MEEDDEQYQYSDDEWQGSEDEEMVAEIAAEEADGGGARPTRDARAPSTTTTTPSLTTTTPSTTTTTTTLPDRRDRSGSERLADGAYAVIHKRDVARMMMFKANELSELLEVPMASAEALLRETGWSSERLMEAFWNDGASLSKRVGVVLWEKACEEEEEEAATVPEDAQGARAGVAAGCDFAADRSVALPRAEEAVTCRICFCDVEASETRGAPCRHWFCGECYAAYLTNAVDEGAACVHTTCPEAACKTLVPPGLFARLLGGPKLARYRQFRVEHFVSFSKELRWCPAPGCENVVRAGPCVSTVKCAPAGCGFAFCMRCGEDAHQPSTCALLRTWLEKCRNESETANWILANTKRCPKCTTRIEKNQGCNHMSCSQCKYEFCWMCMGDWLEHGATTGGYYKCNKFDPTKGEEGDSDSTRAKRELDRYLHYYKRFHGHDLSLKFAVKQLEATEKRMVELQETTHGSWIDVQFLKTANEMVIDCRRTLKSTYVFGYYLPLDSTKQRELFENLQQHLERFTETLSEMTELPLDQMDRTEVVNITRVTESFLVNLIAGAESGLDVPDDLAAT